MSKYTTSVVAFIDILGFKDKVKEEEKEGKYEFFSKLRIALQEALIKTFEFTKNTFKNFKSLSSKFDEENFEERLKLKTFSDNVFFSFDYSPDDEIQLFLATFYIIYLSTYFQRIMLTHNLYVRGAITIGCNFVDDTMIFSGALIKAFEMEKERAIYPRIVVDKELAEKYVKIKNTLVPCDIFYPNILVKDWSGTVFCNPFKLESDVRLFYDKGLSEKMKRKVRNDGEKIKKKTFEKGIEKLKNNLHSIDLPSILPYRTDNTETNKRVGAKVGSVLGTKPLENFLYDEKKDGEVIKIVQTDLNKNLEIYHDNYEVYEKYLWLSEFVKWIKGENTLLNFEFFKERTFLYDKKCPPIQISNIEIK